MPSRSPSAAIALIGTARAVNESRPFEYRTPPTISEMGMTTTAASTKYNTAKSNATASVYESGGSPSGARECPRCAEVWQVPCPRPGSR